MVNYIYVTERPGTVLDTQAWSKGESHYLQRLIGTGFYKTLYICNDGMVKFYYDENEVKQFEKMLEEVDEDFFNMICTDFMILCDKVPDMIENATGEEKLQLFSEMIPALTIFYEFDNYPDYMNDSMKRRLMRVRENSESKPYELLNDVKLGVHKDFIIYRGMLYLK